MVPARAAARTAPWPDPPPADGAVRERLLWYPCVARWAPSKHNTQPWRFVVRDDQLEVWTDTSRALTGSDPDLRELVLSCGAAVHHVEVAAHALGHEMALQLLPDGDSGPLVRLSESAALEPSAHDSALLEAVPVRRTDRGPLDRTGLAPSLPFRLQSAALVHGVGLRLVASAADRAVLADLVARADRVLARTDAVDRELEQWLRDPCEGAADGVPRDRTRGQHASYRAELVQRDFSGRDGTAVAPAHWREGPDHPVLAVLCTDGDGPRDWVAAGRALSAALLEATVAGANASYLNQPVEVTDLRSQLRSALALSGAPQVVLRIGAGGRVAPTPRRPIEDMRSWA